MQKFLKDELDNYLTGRAFERKKELPLLRVEQPYIHYRKGSSAMHVLRDYIGEGKLNAALAKFAPTRSFNSRRTRRRANCWRYLREATPPRSPVRR